MSADPAFAATLNHGSQLLGNAETNLQVPTTTSTVVTAGTLGTKIEEIIITATAASLVGTTVAGLVYIFEYDGATYHLYDIITVPANTGSSTLPPWRFSKTYTNLFLKTGWSLRASQSIAGNASILKFSAVGGDY